MRFDFTSRGKTVTVEVTIATSGSAFERLVKHLASKALDSKSGVAKIAHGVIVAKIVR